MINTGVRFVKDVSKNIHAYYNHNNERYISVTSLLGGYKQKFDKNFWSIYKAIQHKLNIPVERKSEFSKMYVKYGGDSKWETLSYEPLVKICVDSNISIDSIQGLKKEIGDKWDVENKKSTDRGTRYHDKKEQESYSSGKDTIGKDEAITVTSYSFNLMDLKDGFHSELMLYNHKWKLAGQMDKAIIVTDLFGIRWVKADDYKTNKKIDIKNPIGKKMKFPLNHLDDCNFIHYCLQINTYMFMLIEEGYKASFPARFTHVLLNDREEEIGSTAYMIPDMQKEVKDMLNHYRNA